MADKKTSKIKYSEPADYFPKEIRDKFLNGNKKIATKKTVKGTKKKK